MKKSLADKIEQYIKVLIERSEDHEIVMQRLELAETFNCVPSQVTYVINTRFTESEGYLAESRRGGKGYVRITKFVETDDSLVEFNQKDLSEFINQLYKEAKITKNEHDLLNFITIYLFKDLKAVDKNSFLKNMKNAVEEFTK